MKIHWLTHNTLGEARLADGRVAQVESMAGKPPFVWRLRLGTQIIGARLSWFAVQRALNKENSARSLHDNK